MLNGRCGLSRLPARSVPKDLMCCKNSSSSFPAQIQQTRTLFLNEKAKGGEKNLSAPWLNALYQEKECAQSCAPPEHHYSCFLRDFTMYLLSSVGFTALTTPLQCFPWREGSGNCKRQFCSGNTCICMRHETALVAEKENHAATRGKQEGNRGKTSSQLHAPNIDGKKIRHSDAMGKKQIAPSAHK